MSSTAADISRPVPPSADREDHELSLARLYVLRAMYLVLVVAGGIAFLPQLVGHEPTARGVIPSMLAGMWLLACFGLRYPVQMLPILLFELAWKTIWLVDYGLPQWRAGVNTPVFKEDWKAIALGPLIFLLVIPWGYVFRHYVKKPGSRWR